MYIFDEAIHVAVNRIFTILTFGSTRSRSGSTNGCPKIARCTSSSIFHGVVLVQGRGMQRHAPSPRVQVKVCLKRST